MGRRERGGGGMSVRGGEGMRGYSEGKMISIHGCSCKTPIWLNKQDFDRVCDS